MRRYATLILMMCSVLFAPAVFAGMNIFACEPEWAALAKEIGLGTKGRGGGRKRKAKA